MIDTKIIDNMMISGGDEFFSQKIERIRGSFTSFGQIVNAIIIILVIFGVNIYWGFLFMLACFYYYVSLAWGICCSSLRKNRKATTPDPDDEEISRAFPNPHSNVLDDQVVAGLTMSNLSQEGSSMLGWTETEENYDEFFRNQSRRIEERESISFESHIFMLLLNGSRDSNPYKYCYLKCLLPTDRILFVHEMVKILLEHNGQDHR